MESSLTRKRDPTVAVVSSLVHLLGRINLITPFRINLDVFLQIIIFIDSRLPIVDTKYYLCLLTKESDNPPS